MNRTFGDFIEIRGESDEFLKIAFSPSSVPIQQRWRNNGLSADFLADYVSTFFPGDDPESSDRQAEVRDTVSYIANELLENAMKFTPPTSSDAVSIVMHLRRDAIVLYVSNSLDSGSVVEFQEFITRLLTEDTDALHMQRMMEAGSGEQETESGLGLLTMVNDYSADLAWKFQAGRKQAGVTTVTTMARVSV
jgi:hypothetical protein